jgi:L-2-hydroxyglutarate oxidase
VSSGSDSRYDVVVIGAGIVGLAVASALVRSAPRLSIAVIEKESVVAAHQTGHNSGVVHSGIYYRPGTAKAMLAVNGHASMVRFCSEYGVRCEQLGKLIVAVTPTELERLAVLKDRARSNGVACRSIDRQELAELEPNVNGLAAMYIPTTSVVDYRQVCDRLASLLGEDDVALYMSRPCLDLTEDQAGVRLETPQGELKASAVVNCGGLWADRVAESCYGTGREVAIVPFRGEYYNVTPPQDGLVGRLIYPVPDPVYPFLGVHLTPGVNGGLHAGPSAVLALSRAGYTWRQVSLRDTMDLITYSGTWMLAARHWRDGVRELQRSLSRHAFGEAVRRLVPAIEDQNLVRSPAGVRAQALSRRGVLLDDFVIQQHGRVVNVINAPSPAATASFEIGKLVAAKALAVLG